YADQWQEILRHPDRDECGSDAGAAHRGGHWNQCEPGEFPGGSEGDCDLAETGFGHGVVARGIVRGFAKIARLGISDSPATAGCSRVDSETIPGAFVFRERAADQGGRA